MKHRLFLLTQVLCISLFLSSFLPKKLQRESHTADWGDGRYSLININNINGFVRYDGLFGQDPNDDSGIFYPAGSAGIVFTEGVVWGGYVNDPDSNKVKLRIGGQRYYVGTTPGRILSSGVAQDPQDERVRVYRIRKDWKTIKDDDAQIAAEIKLLHARGSSTDSSVTAGDIIDQYQKDWQEWPVEYGAPFYDLNKNGIYEPGLGETPGVAGADQVLWFVVNDLSENRTLRFSGSPPIGIELQITLWGYDQPGLPLEQANFRRYRLINKSPFRIDSMYIGNFSDTDIGSFADDFVGCDSLLELGYAYNSSITDIQFDPFNLYPPAAGYQLLQGPIVPSAEDKALFDFKNKAGFKNLPLNAFSYYGPGCACDPIIRDEAIKAYNYMRGYENSYDMSSLKPYVHRSGPDKGKITRFPLSGDPLRGTGDIDGQGENRAAGDRRFYLASGPLTMAPGDTQEVVYALIGGLGNAYYPYCVEALKLNARYIQKMYPDLDGLSDPFPQPLVNGLSDNARITLEWGSDDTLSAGIEQDQAAGVYRFEGYNIYQLPSEAAPDDQAVLIETIDTKDAPGGVFGYKTNPVTGIYEYKLLANGSNSGIRHYTTVERDYFTNQPFRPGKTYTFAVSAYRYLLKTDTSFPIIESKLTRINVLAHEFNPGYSADTGQEIEAQHSGSSTGYVKAVVVNPANLTGHTYRVTFDEEQRWTLTDVNTGEVKLTNQENISGDENYPVVDGIMPVVWGPVESGRLKIKWDYHYENFGIGGYDWGGQVFDGSIGLGENFFGSTIPRDSLLPVRIEFQEKFEVEQNGWAGKGAVYLNDSSLSYIGTGNMPLKAFDISLPEQPRRLNICFTENPETSNRIWDMGWDGAQFPDERGADEYLLIMNSSYDEGISYDNDHKGTTADVLYVLWLKERDSYGFLNGYGRFDLLPSRRNFPEDTFVYTTPPPPNLPTKFDLLPAYPNPFNGSIKFRLRIPLQSKVSIDIYDINGRHVTQVFDSKLEQGTHTISWQPEELASGMYIYRAAAGRRFKMGKILYLK